MVVPSYDMAQDDMMTFMTGQKSEVREFLDKWQGSPVEIIINPLKFFVLPRDLVRLTADWVEHALRAFKERHPLETRPAEALEALRQFIDDEIGKEEFDKAALCVRDGIFSYKRPDRFIMLAAHEATMAGSYLHAIESGKRHMESNYEQMKSAILSASLNSNLESGGHVKPGNWQIRRFAHVMECIQAKKPWPKIGETL